MLDFVRGGTRFRISLLFPALLTALYWCQPRGLAAACLLASFIHECGHLLAMFAVGVLPESCTLGVFGMRIRLQSSTITYGKGIWISVAGPVANGLAALLFLVLRSPEGAAVHLALGCLNLLPVAALDGGEILRDTLCILGLESVALRVVRIASYFVLVPLLIMSLFFCFCQQGNPTLLIVSSYLIVLLIFSEKNEKTS